MNEGHACVQHGHNRSAYLFVLCTQGSGWENIWRVTKKSTDEWRRVVSLCLIHIWKSYGFWFLATITCSWKLERALLRALNCLCSLGGQGRRERGGESNRSSLRLLAPFISVIVFWKWIKIPIKRIHRSVKSEGYAGSCPFYHHDGCLSLWIVPEFWKRCDLAFELLKHVSSGVQGLCGPWKHPRWGKSGRAGSVSLCLVLLGSWKSFHFLGLCSFLLNRTAWVEFMST
jgi:hypothetical protein